MTNIAFESKAVRKRIYYGIIPIYSIATRAPVNIMIIILKYPYTAIIIHEAYLMGT
jgi:hypothetical protein